MSVPDRFRPIVGAGSAAAGAIGVPGSFVPGADVPILLSIWGVGGCLIADESGNAGCKGALKGFIASSLSGSALFVGGSKLASTCFHLVPGPGTLAAIGVNSSLNAFFTYRFLRCVSKVFDRLDDEEMIMQSLASGVTLFSVFGIASDFADMKDCICEGRRLIDQFTPELT